MPARHPAPNPPGHTPGSGSLRIVIVDDHPIVRKGLTELINHEPDMIVCGESDTADGGLGRIVADRPAVAIIDLSLGMDSGLRLVKRLNASLPEVKILVLSMHDEKLHAERALAAGASGYIMKDAAMQHLIGAIRCVASGRTYVSAEMSERIVARMTGRRDATSATAPLERLTDREREIFTLIGQGLGTRDIAQRLAVSVKTVETHQARIKEKLGLTHVRELMRAAVSWGAE